jgi:hypothetical protein
LADTQDAVAGGQPRTANRDVTGCGGFTPLLR